MAEPLNIQPPQCNNDGTCDHSERMRFDAQVAMTLNALALDVQKLADAIGPLEKMRDRVNLMAVAVVAGFGLIQWAASMYISKAIDDRLAPISTQLQKLEEKDRLNAVLLKPESLLDTIRALNETQNRMDDRLRAVEKQVEKK